MVQPWVPVHHSRCTKKKMSYDSWGSATQGGQRRTWVMRFSLSRCTKKKMSYEVQPASDRKKGTIRERVFWESFPWTIPKTISKKRLPHFLQAYLFYFILNKELFFPINFHNNYFSPFLITTSNFIIISLFFPIHQNLFRVYMKKQNLWNLFYMKKKFNMYLSFHVHEIYIKLN
jgi:hypothetical protein